MSAAKKKSVQKKKIGRNIKIFNRKIKFGGRKNKNLIIQRKTHGRKINKISFNRHEWNQINRQTYRSICLLRWRWLCSRGAFWRCPCGHCTKLQLRQWHLFWQTTTERQTTTQSKCQAKSTAGDWERDLGKCCQVGTCWASRFICVWWGLLRV